MSKTTKDSTKADRDKLDAAAADFRKLQKQRQKEASPDIGKPKHELKLLEIHPLAQLVPEMSPERYKEFCADVEANGLTDPVITLYEGKILDGRHRDRA